MPQFPRWIAGGPDDTSAASPILLREVAEGLLVGSAMSVGYVGNNFAVAQFSSHCPAAERFAVLRILFSDQTAVPVDVMELVVAFARTWRGKRPLLLQCYAGLSRSATMAYTVLRRVDGMTHEAALARVEHVTEHMDRTTRWPHATTLASARAWCDLQGA